MLLVGIVRAAVGHHGRFYISFRTIFEEEGKEKHEKSTCNPAYSRDAAGRADRLRQQEGRCSRRHANTEDTDKAAADNVAALIDAIYVQERTDETDAQCEAARLPGTR